MEEAGVPGVDIGAFFGVAAGKRRALAGEIDMESHYPCGGYKIREKITGQTFFNARAKSASVPGFASSKRENK
ncbi:MAG TPA: hypothetical protein VN326_24250 [Casimicrobiaceae bacterium]|jgi:hypothetical protein|nr:hypothetical protein [Casimicrobiaceae bacterium]